MIIDRLIDAIDAKQNPTALGLDMRPDYLPESVPQDETADAILAFNIALMDAVEDIVPAIKVQAAYYEMLGVAGMKAFRETLVEGEKRGFIVIADAKRNDIGPTAEAYARAYFGGAFPAHFLTVNAYLGSDGVAPFLQYAPDNGIFALVKTSNPSSGELQDLRFPDGRALYEAMGDCVSAWGAPYIGKHGYSAVGAVVGATYPGQGAALRKRLPHTFFLVPGYGAQGADGKALSGMLDENGRGILVNASRSLMLAYRMKEYAGLSFAEATRREALAMKEDLAL